MSLLQYLFGEDFEDKVNEALNTERACATAQASEDMSALGICRGQFTRLSHPELFHYAAVLLREQDRIQHILDHHETGPLKREIIWAALFPHLLAAGYKLPPPYAPGSTFPTYAMAPPRDPSFFWIRPLDLLHCGIMPAVIVETGQPAALKIVCSRRGTIGAEELDIVKLLNSEPLRSHPDNIAFRLLDVVPFPTIPGQPRAADYHILVAPRLQPFDLYELPVNGAMFPLVNRSFRMLALLHSLGIAHRDIGSENFLSTPGSHDIQLIDFGQAQRFDLQQNPTPRVDWIGGQIIIPEVRGARIGTITNRPYDPFSADIFCLAHMWQQLSMDSPLSRDGQELFQRMSGDDPALRPSAAECVASLEHCLSHLPFWRKCMPVPLILVSIENAKDGGDYSTCLRHVRRYLLTLVDFLFARVVFGFLH